MPFIRWSEEYATNIAEIDAQHQKLIALINTLHEEMKMGKAGYAISEIIDELADYTNYHFTLEESLMVRHNYILFDAHKKEHKFFIAKVKGYQDKTQYENSSLPIDVINFLREWLLHHIIKADKMLPPAFNNSII